MSLALHIIAFGFFANYAAKCAKCTFPLAGKHFSGLIVAFFKYNAMLLRLALVDLWREWVCKVRILRKKRVIIFNRWFSTVLSERVLTNTDSCSCM